MESTLSKTPSQVSTLAPTVTVNEEVDPPTITVGINGKEASANLPIGGGTSGEVIQFSSLADFIQDTANNYRTIYLNELSSTIQDTFYAIGIIYNGEIFCVGNSIDVSLMLFRIFISGSEIHGYAINQTPPEEHIFTSCTQIIVK